MVPCFSGWEYLGVMMTDQDWFDLEEEYRAIFGEGIPRMMLPADEAAAAALVREAIRKRDDSLLDPGIPSDAMI